MCSYACSVFCLSVSLDDFSVKPNFICIFVALAVVIVIVVNVVFNSRSLKCNERAYGNGICMWKSRSLVFKRILYAQVKYKNWSLGTRLWGFLKCFRFRIQIT